jgi:hypothetical protein
MNYRIVKCRRYSWIEDFGYSELTTEDIMREGIVKDILEKMEAYKKRGDYQLR